MVRPYRFLVYALTGLGAFVVVFVAGGAIGWGTPAANEQAIGEVSRWCERVSGGLLREPSNTLGNLGFVVAGLSMFVVLARDEISRKSLTNRFIGNRPTALVYAGAVVFLGPGSMVMHGSHTFFGAWLDNLSMIIYILIPWIVNLAILGRWNDRRFFVVYGSVLTTFAVGYWVFGSDLGIGLDLFGLSIALWVISEAIYRFWSPTMRWLSGIVGFAVALIFGITPATMIGEIGRYWWVVLFWLPALLARNSPDSRRAYSPWYWAGFASFMVGYAIWTTGVSDSPLCRPDSIFQAHAAWHLLTALATWSFFKFLRTERSIVAA